MPKKPDDLSKDTFHRVDRAEAELIIDETFSRARRKLHRPTADALVDAVDDLLRDYEVRRAIDVMPDLEAYDVAYDELRRTSEMLRIAVNKIITNHELLYFFLVAMPYTAWSLTPDEVEVRMFQVTGHAAEIAKFANAARKEVASSVGVSGSRRWYELVEGRATNWLYGNAIPSLFEELFKAKYRIPHEQHSTSPGLRFGLTLLATAGLPMTSRSNLLERLTIAKGLHGLKKSADGSH